MSRALAGLGISLALPARAGSILAARQADLERLAPLPGRLRDGEVQPDGEPARFLELLYPEREVLPAETVDTIEAWADNLQLGSRVRRLVAFGIGGSSLGPRFLHEALAPTDLADAVLHVDTVDPDAISRIYAGLDLARTHFLFTSKSGTTAETAAQYVDCLARLEAAGLSPADHVTMITGTSGWFRSEARRLGLVTFPVPEGVGGRFSVLSAVGLLPARAARIDVRGLLAGGRALDEALEAAPPAGNPALQLAVLVHEYAVEQGRRVLCPFVYSDRLALLGDWLTQLLMESLGKDGTGLTVLPARGTADQHSILQDLAEGHPDKVVLFVSAARPEADVALPAELPGEGGPRTVAGQTFARLLEACRLGTRSSLEEAGRPTFDLVVDRADARSVGALIVYFEIVTALLAALFRVNAFDQPGVEHSKKKTKELLGRPGV